MEGLTHIYNITNGKHEPIKQAIDDLDINNTLTAQQSNQLRQNLKTLLRFNHNTIFDILQLKQAEDSVPLSLRQRFSNLSPAARCHIQQDVILTHLHR